MVQVRGGNSIRGLRVERGLTQSQLADRVGAHFTTIAKLERSHRRLTVDWIERLAAALDVPPALLLHTNRGDTAPIRMIPLVGRISAGNWKEAVETSGHFVPAVEGGSNAFALEPEGDSMNLIVPEGGLVIVDPDQFELLDGKIYAVMNSEGETTFKRFRATPPRLEPCSSNPEHQPIALGREPFTVVGRVVAQQSVL